MDGADTLDKVVSFGPDVILLDVMMPGIDGFETCKKIKENPETTHIPVVMVTALSELEDRVKGLESGADEFLTKPINDIALFARVKSLARMKTVIDELKLRNTINAELGATVIELKDNFLESKILLFDDDESSESCSVIWGGMLDSHEFVNLVISFVRIYFNTLCMTTLREVVSN